MSELTLGHTASARGLLALHAALERQTENEYSDVGDPYNPKPPKFWPSTIPHIDTVCGGFYGVSVVTGQPGTGKTLLSIASAIEAAASGNWQVVILSAEDDKDGFRERFNRYLSVHPAAQDCIGNLHYHAVGKGQDASSLTLTIHHCIDHTLDTPILIVIDSINSIVNLSHGSYLSLLKEIGLWAMFSRRLSAGDVSFFITAETNKSGEVKGEALSFWSDVYLKMKWKSENVVDMNLAKTRRTAGAGPMGNHLRNWSTGRFEPEEQRSLYAVGSDIYE